MPKSIVFVTNRLAGGGSERVLITLANAFVGKGYNVSIISFRKGESYPINKNIGIYTLENKLTKISRILALRKLFIAFGPDTVISFEYFVNMQVILAAFSQPFKVVVSERNDPARKGGEFPNKVFRNILYKYCDVLVCQTPDAKAYFPQKIQRSTVVIPNPIKEGLPEPKTVDRNREIVNFCRLEKQKNLILLIDAFEEFHRQYRDYTLTIYGDGSEESILKEHIAVKGLEKAVTLHQSIKEVHERILKSAMFVSSSDYEGLSNSMLEAMAIGLPVICTDCPCGGAKMVIKDGINGLLVPVRNQEVLVSAMLKIVENPSFATEIGRNAVMIRDDFSLNNICERWINVI